MRAGSDFTHVLLTRFNLATPGRESTLRNRPGWLNRRFELFERHCLPSVAAQSDAHFHWIIFFDKDTPEPFRTRIAEAQAVRPFTAFFTGLFKDNGWIRAIRERVGAETPWLLTTRLDNDDGLASDFVARLHAKLRGQPTPSQRVALNFRQGFVLQDGRLYAHHHESNAFVSLLEPFDEEARTTSSIKHMEMADYARVHQIDGPGAWLQVVHEENVSNVARGRLIAPSAAAAPFAPGVLGQLAPVSAADLATDRFLNAPLRVLRDFARMAGRRVRDRMRSMLARP
ncbi:MAG: glycosyltransferase [Pseudomonadota bacterium]